MAKSTTDSQLVDQAIATLALKAHCGRAANRSLVESGTTYDGVSLSVTGHVGKRPVAFEIAGELRIGVDNPVGSTRKPSADVMLATAMDLMPKTRVRVLTDLAHGGKLDKPSAESLKAARAVIDALATKSPRSGSVSFVETSAD